MFAAINVGLNYINVTSLLLVPKTAGLRRLWATSSEVRGDSKINLRKGINRVYQVSSGGADILDFHLRLGL